MLSTRMHRLGADQRDALLGSLLPEAVRRQTARLVADGMLDEGVGELETVYRPERGELKLRSPGRRVEGDFGFQLDLDQSGEDGLELAFIQVNDLYRPRYGIDTDARGLSTLLGTARRNIAEEVRAMRDGLGPGQVRHGLRAFGDFFERLVRFAKMLGYANILLQPLTYHDALLYERHGFAYVTGRRAMEEIDAGFRPGGEYSRRLDGSTPFRAPAAADSRRGRSWAIHDNILGRPLPELRMAYTIGQPGQRETTFTGTAGPAGEGGA